MSCGAAPKRESSSPDSSLCQDDTAPHFLGLFAIVSIPSLYKWPWWCLYDACLGQFNPRVTVREGSFVSLTAILDNKISFSTNFLKNFIIILGERLNDSKPYASLNFFRPCLKA